MIAMLCQCGFLTVFVCALVTTSTAKDVNTLNGPITGTYQAIDGKQVWEFLAVPFAEPPIGSLRFRAPKTLTRTWTEPLIANKPPNACLQLPFQFIVYGDHLKTTHSEDCLYLNVWTPNVDTQRLKSVMVWIHGGGFISGESLPVYNGKALSVIGDVVVVSIQYRLGFLGFARFDNELIPGNNGLLDQQLALKWVHENIAAFGGDPESVTIFGESAGAASIGFHMMHEESGRYFKRAIMQSGSVGHYDGWSFNPNTDALEALNSRIAKKYLNCDQIATSALLKCLESKSEDEMKVLISNYTIDATQSGEPSHGPTIDGRFLSRNPLEILASGEISRKDLIIGFTESEGSIFVTFMSMLAAPDGFIHELVTPKFVKNTINHYMSYYPHFPHKMSSLAMEMAITNSISYVDPTRGEYNAIKLAESLGQSTVTCSVNKFADYVRSVHENVYFYELAHAPSHPPMPILREDWMKCSHGDDIPFIFALPLVYPGLRNMTDDELQLSRRMIGDWANFAKTGHPLDPNWKTFTPKEKGYFRYKLQSSFETGGIRRDECVFWDKILPMVNKLACEGDEQSRCKPSDSKISKKYGKTSKDEL